MDKKIVFIEDGDYTPDNVKDGCVKTLTLVIFFLTFLLGCGSECF